MLGIVKHCTTVLMIAAILVFGGLVIAGFLTKPATPSSSPEAEAAITATGTSATCGAQADR
jgi:hypothetical protein